MKNPPSAGREKLCFMVLMEGLAASKKDSEPVAINDRGKIRTGRMEKICLLLSQPVGRAQGTGRNPVFERTGSRKIRYIPRHMSIFSCSGW
jgi:hypothetical protein